MGSSPVLRPGLSLGALIALAYPDPVVQTRDHADTGMGSKTQRQKQPPSRHRNAFRRYVLRDGFGANIAVDHPLGQSDFIAIAQSSGQAGKLTIRSGAPIDQAEIEDLFAAHIEEKESIHWHRQRDMVQSRQETQLGRLILAYSSLAKPQI